MKKIVLTGAACALWIVNGAAFANEPISANAPTGNFAWQFRSANERAVRAGIEDMRLRQNAGAFGPASITQNFYNTSLDCVLSSSAVGNASNTTAAGTVSSPSLLNAPNVAAGTYGNIRDGLQGGGTSTATQGNAGSNLTSNVSGTTSALTSGTIDAGNGQLSQVLNQGQSNTNSPQSSMVSNSTACQVVGR